MKSFKRSLLCFLLFSMFSTNAHKIGLAIVATGSYLEFVQPLLASARQYFCTEDEVTYFVFTDGVLPAASDVVVLAHQRYGWPLDTMFRSLAYVQHADALSKMDYIFALDADTLFAKKIVSSELVSARVATLHAGYYKRTGPIETRKESRAYLDSTIMRPYFAGGFYGGTSAEFLKMARTMQADMEADLANGITPIWHDESVLNHYFEYNKPTRILSPEYCMTDPRAKNPRWLSAEIMAMEGKLIVLAKDHATLQVS
jgi:hypothetical protein